MTRAELLEGLAEDPQAAVALLEILGVRRRLQGDRAEAGLRSCALRAVELADS